MSWRDPERIDDHQLLGELAKWASETRTTNDAGARSRQARLQRQSAESTDWASLVLGWAEREARVRVTTVTGKSHHGSVRAMGRDFVLLSTTAGNPRTGVVLIATSGIAFVCRSDIDGFETGPARDGFPHEQVRCEVSEDLGDLGYTTELGQSPSPEPAMSESLLDLSDALAEMAVSRPRLRVATGPGPSLVGELVWVGADVMCLRAEGSPPNPVYVRLATVVEVSVLGT